MDDKIREEGGLIESEEKRRAPQPPQGTPPSAGLQQISGHRDRMTYVFQKEGNVGCVHYDALRGEIYLNGHNIRTMNLTEAHWQILEEFRMKLRSDPRFRSSSYAHTLTQIAREKEHSSS